MYKYEELNLVELMTSDAVDNSESPEALYAIAQCYRLGKGTEIDIELYKKSLQDAADAGSELAKEELQTLEEQPEEKVEGNEPEVQKDFTKLPMDELMDLVHEDDIRACCEVYQRYGESKFLVRAGELIDQGNHSLSKEECQKILETLAAYYLDKRTAPDRAKGMEAYGKAAELGSAKACWKLAELCVDEQQKMFYAKKAAGLGSDKDAYRYAEMLQKKGRVAEADACFVKLMKKADLDESLKVQIKIQHHTDTEIREVVRLAWSHTEKKVCRDFLTEYYGPSYGEALGEEKNITADQAYQLAMWNKGDGWAQGDGVYWWPTEWYKWLTFAAKEGSAEALSEAKKQCEKWYQQGIEELIAGENGSTFWRILTFNKEILDERFIVYAKILEYSHLKKTSGRRLSEWNYITIQGNKYEVKYGRAGSDRIVPQVWKFAEEPLCKGYLANYYDPTLFLWNTLPTASQAYKLAMWNKGAGWGGVRGDEWIDNPWYRWLIWSAERGCPQAIVEAGPEEDRRKSYREEKDRIQRQQEREVKVKKIRDKIIALLIIVIVVGFIIGIFLGAGYGNILRGVGKVVQELAPTLAAPVIVGIIAFYVWLFSKFLW